MKIIEIVFAIILIITSLALIAVTLGQSEKQQGMTSAISGGSNSDSFYGKNGGNTREKALENLTKIIAAIFFISAIAVNVISAVAK
ncbi:MAG: preprotein translocase subunit SecG [Oscillospiraceae bacterium]|nr:preprotein translocase subunit SecG [Oscillospiraceae bacterium]